jgi:RNA-directed DNA polymerase
MRLGLEKGRALKSATNGRGPWWNAGASHMNAALPKKYFDRLGLLSLVDQMRKYWQFSQTAVCGTARTVVWEDG